MKPFLLSYYVNPKYIANFNPRSIRDINYILVYAETLDEAVAKLNKTLNPTAPDGCIIGSATIE